MTGKKEEFLPGSKSCPCFYPFLYSHAMSKTTESKQTPNWPLANQPEVNLHKRNDLAVYVRRTRAAVLIRNKPPLIRFSTRPNH